MATKLLLLGNGPLPDPDVRQLGSGALRTCQFLRPILRAGHHVNLFTFPLPGADLPADAPAAISPANFEGLSYQRFTNRDPEFALQMISDLLDQLAPEALVAVGSLPAFVAASLPGALPLWADLPAYWIADAQGRAWIEQDDSRLADAWAVQRTILRRLDKFSTPTRPQLHASLGELAALGRLSSLTFEYPFGHQVPHCLHRLPDYPADPQPDAQPQPDTSEVDTEPDSDDTPVTESPAADSDLQSSPRDTPILRGPAVPTDAFIILWAGAFTPAADVPLLVSAANKLMDRYPAVHVAITGGPSHGRIARNYELLVELVDQSPHKSRFHLLGWLPLARLRRLMTESDVGVNVDARNYETLFAGRVRIHTMVGAGLAVASTVGAEITEWLEDGRALLSAPLGDAEALVDAIEPWIEQREELRTYAGRARAILNRDFNEAKTTVPLVRWLERPKLAPDNRLKLDQSPTQPPPRLGDIALNSLEGEATLLTRYSPDRLAQAAAQLDAATEKRPLFTFRRPR